MPAGQGADGDTFLAATDAELAIIDRRGSV
jgi:hypothetical protein